MKCFAAGTLRVSALCPASLQQPPGSQCVCSKVLHPSLARKKTEGKIKALNRKESPKGTVPPALHSSTVQALASPGQWGSSQLEEEVGLWEPLVKILAVHH